MSVVIILQRMLILFAMMIIGYFCYKKDWINDDFYGRLSKIVVGVMNPLLIINGVINKDTSGIGDMIGINIILVIGYFIVLTVVSYPLVRMLRVKVTERGLYQAMLIFSNVGFMGIPVISSLYGEVSTIFVSFYILAYNILLYTFGLVLVGKSVPEKEKSSSGFSLKSILNTGVAACVIAIVIFAFRIRVPEFAESFVSYVGNAAVPCSMMLVGVGLARADLKKMFSDVRMLVFILIRSVIIPVVIALIMKYIPVDGELKGICCLMFAMPIGSIVALVANNAGADDQMCAQACALNTLFSVLTIPIVTAFFALW